MIRSFHDRNTELLYGRISVPRYKAFEQVARRKLRQLNAATELRDMSAPPGNRLEALRGNRIGQYSVRINEQWRICFRWTGRDAEEVEIVDYH